MNTKNYNHMDERNELYEKIEKLIDHLAQKDAEIERLKKIVSNCAKITRENTNKNSVWKSRIKKAIDKKLEELDSLRVIINPVSILLELKSELLGSKDFLEKSPQKNYITLKDGCPEHDGGLEYACICSFEKPKEGCEEGNCVSLSKILDLIDEKITQTEHYLKVTPFGYVNQNRTPEHEQHAIGRLGALEELKKQIEESFSQKDSSKTVIEK